MDTRKKEIAEELGVHISTVYRELKRGTYEHLNSDYTTEERYSPEKAEARYQEGLAAKGAPLKIGKNHAAAQFIEDKIGNEDYSPAAVCALLKQEKYKHFGITFLPCDDLQVRRGRRFPHAHKSRPPGKGRPQKEA